MRISDCSSDVCSSDLATARRRRDGRIGVGAGRLQHAPPLRGPIDRQQIGHGVARMHRGARCRAAAEQEAVVPVVVAEGDVAAEGKRSEEHTSELQSLMRISYAVFCLKKKNNNKTAYNKKHSHSQN